MESRKSCLPRLLLSKKHIPSAKTLYTEDLSNITFSYLCENSPNSLCHFYSHKSFFTTQLACVILAQTLHTFDKNISSKCKFSDFPLLEFWVKIHQISHVIAKNEFWFSWITLQCHERQLFCTFLAETLYASDKSSTWKCKFSELSLLALKFT